MEWTVTIEGPDEFGEIQRAQVQIEKGFERLASRGMPPGHYFATSNTSQLEMRARTLQALQFEGYSGHGEVTILSDGAEIHEAVAKGAAKTNDAYYRLVSLGD